MRRDVTLEIISLYFCAFCAVAWAALIIFGLVMIHALLEDKKNNIDAFFQAAAAAGLTILLGGVGAHAIIALTFCYWRYCMRGNNLADDDSVVCLRF